MICIYNGYGVFEAHVHLAQCTSHACSSLHLKSNINRCDWIAVEGRRKKKEERRKKKDEGSEEGNSDTGSVSSTGTCNSHAKPGLGLRGPRISPSYCPSPFYSPPASRRGGGGDEVGGPGRWSGPGGKPGFLCDGIGDGEEHGEGVGRADREGTWRG